MIRHRIGGKTLIRRRESSREDHGDGVAHRASYVPAAARVNREPPKRRFRLGGRAVFRFAGDGPTLQRYGIVLLRRKRAKRIMLELMRMEAPSCIGLHLEKGTARSPHDRNVAAWAEPGVTDVLNEDHARLTLLSARSCVGRRQRATVVRLFANVALPRHHEVGGRFDREGRNRPLGIFRACLDESRHR